MALTNYTPKGDIKMRIEFSETTMKTCKGVKPGFRVQRVCSHGCDCIGTLIGTHKEPNETLAQECAPCGKPGLSIKGQGKDVRLIEETGGRWVFEMSAGLFERQRPIPSTSTPGHGKSCA